MTHLLLVEGGQGHLAEAAQPPGLAHVGVGPAGDQVAMLRIASGKVVHTLHHRLTQLDWHLVQAIQQDQDRLLPLPQGLVQVRPERAQPPLVQRRPQVLKEQGSLAPPCPRWQASGELAQDDPQRQQRAVVPGRQPLQPGGRLFGPPCLGQDVGQKVDQSGLAGTGVAQQEQVGLAVDHLLGWDATGFGLAGQESPQFVLALDPLQLGGIQGSVDVGQAQAFAP